MWSFIYMRNRLGVAITFSLVAIPCVSCNKQANERVEAMLQMQRLVGLLHSNERLLRNVPGFPESAYLSTNGSPACSWRLTILSTSLSGPYPDQPWNSPINQAQDTEGQRQLFSVRGRSKPSMYTQVFALVGRGTAFTEFGVSNRREPSEAEPDAILLLDTKNHLIHWMEPGDIEVAPLLGSRESGFDDLQPNYPEGFLVGFVDGAVWWIRHDVPHTVISPFFAIEGAQTHDRETELQPYVIDKIPPLEPADDGRYYLPPARN